MRVLRKHLFQKIFGFWVSSVCEAEKFLLDLSCGKFSDGWFYVRLSCLSHFFVCSRDSTPQQPPCTDSHEIGATTSIHPICYENRKRMTAHLAQEARRDRHDRPTKQAFALAVGFAVRDARTALQPSDELWRKGIRRGSYHFSWQRTCIGQLRAGDPQLDVRDWMWR